MLRENYNEIGRNLNIVKQSKNSININMQTNQPLEFRFTWWNGQNGFLFRDQLKDQDHRDTRGERRRIRYFLNLLLDELA